MLRKMCTQQRFDRIDRGIRLPAERQQRLDQGLRRAARQRLLQQLRSQRRREQRLAQGVNTFCALMAARTLASSAFGSGTRPRSPR